jgi:hypothetical protein
MNWGEMKFSVLLYGMSLALRLAAWRYAAFARRLAEKSFTAQIRTFDGSVARHFTFRNGRVASGSGLHPAPDICISVASGFMLM